MIEMHFHIFTMVALLVIFGSLAPILVAVATIALHHVAFWEWLPCSVFNYNAGFSIVLIHAAFQAACPDREHGREECVQRAKTRA
jgi:methyl-accepting chemotaxis protein